MRTFASLLALVGMMLVAGCGSGKNSGSTGAGAALSGRSSAVLTVKWPQHVATSAGRLIPAAAVNIHVVITRDSDGTTLATVDIPQSQATTAIDALPADRLDLAATALDENQVVEASGSTSFTTQPGVATSVNLTLASTIATITLSPDDSTVYSGDQIALDFVATTSSGDYALLSPDSLVWDVVSGGDVVSIDSTGLVTAGQPGTAYVRVTDTDSGVSGYATITVLPALSTITVSDITYNSGTTIATVTATDDYGNVIDPGDITWATDNSAYTVANGQNPSPVTVSEGAAPGDIQITATQSSTGITATYALSIDVGPPTTLYAAANDITAGGDPVTVTLLAPDGTTYPSGMWTWSTDSGYVTVAPTDGDPVTLTADSSASGSVTVTVSLTGSPFQVYTGSITLSILQPDSDRAARSVRPATRLYAIHLPHTLKLHGVAHKATRRPRLRTPLYKR